MGTTRLAFAFGTGLIGILYLILGLTPVVTRTIEIKPTSLSIETVESDGFPEAEYLEITGGYLVFSEADVRLEDDDAEPPVLARLTLPVISESQLSDWKADTKNEELPDASRCRLLVSFEADQVIERWPDLAVQIARSDFETLPPVQMTVKGESTLVEYMVFDPWGFTRQVFNFNEDHARWIRHDRHFNSAGRAAKNILIAVGLLVLSGFTFRSHFRRPDDVAQDVLDWSGIPDVADKDSGGTDTDLDL